MNPDDIRERMLDAEINQLETQIVQFSEQKQQLDVQIEIAKIKLDALRAQTSTHSGVAKANGSGQKTVYSLRGLGFREAIMVVLRDSKKGLRPRDISRRMLARGFQYTASTEISTRLSNDLAKMKMSGKVKKRGDLYYQNTGAA